MDRTKRVGPHPQAIIAIIKSSALPITIGLAELESRPLVKNCLSLHSVKRKSITYFQHLAIVANNYESSLGTDRLTSLLYDRI